MKKIYFVRHGQTDYNLIGRLQGHTDQPLNGTGVGQAEALAEKLRAVGLTFDRVISSPLIRARRTAEIVSGRDGSGIEIDERIIEKDLGPWEGVLQEDMPKEARAFLRDPWGKDETFGMEHIDHVVARVSDFADWLKTADGESILVASHGGALRVLFGVLVAPDKWEPVLENCALYLVTEQDGRLSRPEKVEL